MRVHYLQHVVFEGPGAIATWLHERRFRVTRTAFYAKEPLPMPSEIDVLIVLGGPMSVHDECSVGWLSVEKAFLQAVIDAGKPVLGICLGAQLIAEVLGGEVRRNPWQEIGWWPVRGLPGADGASIHRFPEEFTAFHWHGETFDLPTGSTLLASSPACPNQAFQWGDRVIGLQFHLETTDDGSAVLIERCAQEMFPGPWVQFAATILDAPQSHYDKAQEEMARLLEFLCAKVESELTLA
ncbi:MAG: type 1 glutamine amidotransferase [Verrucomicrobiales bacterium]